MEGGCAPLRKGKAARSAAGRLESGFALRQRALSGQKSLRQRDVFLARGLRLVSEGGCVRLLLEERDCLAAWWAECSRVSPSAASRSIIVIFARLDLQAEGSAFGFEYLIMMKQDRKDTALKSICLRYRRGRATAVGLC